MDERPIGSRLLVARRVLGLTQTDIGRQLGVGKSRVSQLEHLSAAGVSTRLAGRLTAAYGIPIAGRTRRASAQRRTPWERRQLGQRLRLVLEGDDTPVYTVGMDAATQYRLQRGGRGTALVRRTGKLARLIRALPPSAGSFVEGGSWMLVRDALLTRAFDGRHAHRLAKTLAPLLLVMAELTDDALLDQRLSEAIAKARGPWSVDRRDVRYARSKMLESAARRYAGLAQSVFFQRPVRLGWYGARLNVQRTDDHLLQVGVEILAHPHDAPPRAWWIKKLPPLTRREARRLATAIAGPGGRPHRVRTLERLRPGFFFWFDAIG